MHVLGIDPGKTGGVALIEQTFDGIRRVAGSWVTPIIIGKKKAVYDAWAMFSMLKTMPEDTVGYIELAQAMRKGGQIQGVTSTFSTGYGYGLWVMALTAAEIPFTVVRPQDWMKVVHSGMPKSEKKQNSILMVERTFPGFSLVQPRCQTPHTGIADAINIALYRFMQPIAKGAGE